MKTNDALAGLAQPLQPAKVTQGAKKKKTVVGKPSPSAPVSKPTSGRY